MCTTDSCFLCPTIWGTSRCMNKVNIMVWGALECWPGARMGSIIITNNAKMTLKCGNPLHALRKGGSNIIHYNQPWSHWSGSKGCGLLLYLFCMFLCFSTSFPFALLLSLSLIWWYYLIYLESMPNKAFYSTSVHVTIIHLNQQICCILTSASGCKSSMIKHIL